MAMARCATSTSSACCSRLARAPSWCVCPIARQQGVSDVSPIGRVRMLSFSQELQLTTEQYDVACTGTTSPRLSAMLAGLAASVVLFAGAPGASAQQLYASGSGEYEYPAAERYADRAAERFDENLQTQELRDLLSLLQSGNPKLADLEAARLKVGFQRGADGRVALKGQGDSHWYSIKTDMQNAGVILVRDQMDGSMSFLPPDESGRLMQIDLSDDAVVGQVFGSGAWQDVMEPLKAEDLDGRIVPLVLDEAEFRNTLSLLEDAIEADAE